MARCSLPQSDVRGIPRTKSSSSDNFCEHPGGIAVSQQSVGREVDVEEAVDVGSFLDFRERQKDVAGQVGARKIPQKQASLGASLRVEVMAQEGRFALGVPGGLGLEGGEAGVASALPQALVFLRG